MGVPFARVPQPPDLHHRSLGRHDRYLDAAGGPRLAGPRPHRGRRRRQDRGDVAGLAGAALRLWGGVFIERWDRGRVIICTRVAPGARGRGFLGLRRAVDGPWSLARARSCDRLRQPARHAFVPEARRPQYYVNALALASTAHNLGWLLGPTVAGTPIAVVGCGMGLGYQRGLLRARRLGSPSRRRQFLSSGEREAEECGRVREGLVSVFSL